MPAPTPDDLIASDPPPAFPPWMVAADPRLAAQETNRLYQAFRRRRLLHPRTASQRLAQLPQQFNLRVAAAWLWVLWCLSYVAVVTNVVPLHYLPQWTPNALLLLVVGLQVASWWPRRKSARPVTEAARLPVRLSAGFNHYNGSFDDAVLGFLVEVKARGGEVAEALYLETRERDRHALVATAASALVALVIMSPFLRRAFGSVGWHLLAPVLAALGFLTVLSWVGVHTNRPQLRQLFGHWRKSLPRYASLLGAAQYWFTQEAPQIATMVGLIVGGTILLIVPAVGLAMLAADGRHEIVAWIIAVVFLLAAAAIPPLSRVGMRRSETELAQAMETADLLFDYHLGVVLHDDPDEVRALLIRRGELGIDEYWSPTTGPYS